MTQRVEVSGTQRITYTQEWDAGHRLAVVTATVGGVTQFAYDGDGARVQQVNASGTTLYLGAVELFITGTTRITKTYYALGSEPVALRVVSATANTVYWLHGDALGSLVLVTASAGPGMAQRYTPYGTLRVGGGLPTDLGFTGQRTDGTGLLFYQARYYSPGLGRFISADTIIPETGGPQSLNRYSYVNNNPLKYTDPSGHDLMIVGGVGGDLDPKKWKDWIIAYKGWDARQWEGFYNEWEELNFADGQALLDSVGVRIFSWGGSTLAEGKENAQSEWTGAMVDVLVSEMAGMQDITLLGLSKGGNLVMHYLKRLEAGELDKDTPRPLQAILVSPATHPGGIISNVNPFLNNSIPRTGVKTINICAVGDAACPLKVRGAYNINPPKSYGHTGPIGHFAHGVYAESVFASLNIQGDHQAYEKYGLR